LAAAILHLRVAELGIWLDARKAGLNLTTRPAHTKFLISQPASISAGFDDLTLVVRNTPYQDPDCKTIVCKTDIWELWSDLQDRFIFVAPRQDPPCYVLVDQHFKSGEIFGKFLSSGSGQYPLLQGLEIVIMVNWLAGKGDIILHAAGAVIDGEGHCFSGPSGVGKSTLAATLEENPTISILGEDQIILRYLNNRFWIFGTPWHENPALCSSLGAPLKKFFFLNRAADQRVEMIDPIEGITRLLQTAFIPYYRPVEVSKILDRLDLLAKQVPFYTLSYQIGTDVCRTIRDA
jgi:hypothetical protein